MKKLLLSTAIALLLPAGIASAGTASVISVPAKSHSAHPTLLFGIAVEFGDSVSTPDVGVTAKVLSSNRPNQFVVGGGVGYFPWSDQPFGVDLDIGYTFNHAAILGGYDFLRQKPQLSAGFVPTDEGGKYCDEPGYPDLSGGRCYPVSAVSDRRLKRDIVHLGTLHDGMRIYSFRYLWSDETYVGVIAQDLLTDPRWRDAVSLGPEGYYAVAYEMLDLDMATWDDWTRHGLKAVVRGARPAAFLEQVAA